MAAPDFFARRGRNADDPRARQRLHRLEPHLHGDVPLRAGGREVASGSTNRRRFVAAACRALLERPPSAATLEVARTSWRAALASTDGD
jgi:hypothetical protein